MNLRTIALLCIFFAGSHSIASPLFVLPQHIQQSGPQDLQVSFRYFSEADVIKEGRPRFESDDKEFTQEIRALVAQTVVYSQRTGARLVDSDVLNDFGDFVGNYVMKMLDQTLKNLDFATQEVLAMRFNIVDDSKFAILSFKMADGSTEYKTIDLVEYKDVFERWFSPIKKLNNTTYNKPHN